LRVFARVGFLLFQVDTVEKQFAANRQVPQAGGHDLEDLPFAALILEAKAVTQISGSFSSTCRTPVQRSGYWRMAAFK
jgi:hypothetical protein